MEGDVIVMKMKYTKPSMAVELFSLSQSIAVGCTAVGEGMGEPTHRAKYDCGWQDPSGEVLWDTVEKCHVDTDMDEALQPIDVVVGGLCYNNPDGAFVIFNS